jgi:hypothetical protein
MRKIFILLDLNIESLVQDGSLKRNNTKQETYATTMEGIFNMPSNLIWDYRLYFPCEGSRDMDLFLP